MEQQITDITQEQAQESAFESESFWDDAPEAEPAQAEQPETPAEQTEADTAQEQPAQTPFRVRFNGQERELSYDEAQILAQKGMNYDYVQGQLEAMKADLPLAALVKEAAQAEGVDPGEYVSVVRQRMEAARVAQMQQQGIPPDAAQRIIDAQNEAQRLRGELERLQGAQQQQQAAQAKQRELVDFFARNPNLKPEELPREVLEAARAGESLETAYTRHEITRLTAENAALRNNEKTRLAANGSAIGAGSAANPDKDDFWDSFLSS